MDNQLPEKITYGATWTALENPLFYVKCPHCQSEIFMSSPSVIERLKTWARKFVKLNE